MAFWLQLGASGFRIDAAPFVLEQVAPGVDPGPLDFSILDDWRQDDAVAAPATRCCCARPTSPPSDGAEVRRQPAATGRTTART